MATSKTCLSCGSFLHCKRVEKSPQGSCVKWVPRAGRKLAASIIDELEPFTLDLVEPRGPVLAPERYEELELDLINVLDTIVDPNTKMLRDLKIDDRDFAEFPNVYEFMMDKRGLHLRPFARQLWIHVVMFHEWCPECSDQKMMRDILNVPISMPPEEFPDHVKLLKYGKCPKCKRTKLDFFRSGKLKAYQELAALLGQRVGKSTMLVAPAGTYLLHKYMKMPRPWEMYGLNPTTLFGTVVAQTYQAASDQLWLPIKTYIEGCTWFTEYHDMLKDVQDRKGEELFSFTTTQLYYKHRALMMYPSGPNRKTLRGKTRFFSATDEHDFFDGEEDSEKIKMNGKEVRTSLNNSLANVRIEWRNVIGRGIVNAPGGYSMYVSSPDHAMGVLTQLVKAKAGSKTILALNLATWEIHPKLTRKAIIKAFDPDPMRLERDFGARPPLNNNPFVEDPDVITRMADEETGNRVVIKLKSEMRKERLRIVPEIQRILAPLRMRPTVLAVDAGYSNNSFAMAVLGPPLNPNAGTKCVIHALIEVIPAKKAGTIDFNAVYENVFTPVIQQLNVKAMLADRWNSLKMLHDAAADFDIFVDQYSLKYQDFVFVRSYMESGALRMPKFGMTDAQRMNPDLTNYPACFAGYPVDHFFFQAITVRDLEKTVDKGLNLTDDLWRAVVLGARFVLDEEFAEKYLRGTMAKRAIGGIAAGSYGTNVQGYGNTGVGSVPLSRDQLERQSVVAASGGNYGQSVTIGVSNVFARVPK